MLCFLANSINLWRGGGSRAKTKKTLIAKLGVEQFTLKKHTPYSYFDTLRLIE